MFSKKWIVSAMSLALLLPGTRAGAVEVVKNENAGLELLGRFQLLGVAQHMSDELQRRPGRLFLFMNQARVGFKGRLGDTKFNTEWALGGEEEVKNLNASLSLLDMSADLPVADRVYVKVGQFKVPFGREALVDDGGMLFSTRSINHLAFRFGRDVGAAVVSSNEGLNGTVGIFTGGGRDNPERYLPEDLGIPLLVARVGYDSAGRDMYASRHAGAFDVKESEMSAYVTGAYMEDSLVGHSSVLGVKPGEKSLMTNSNWNPFLTASPLNKGKLAQASVDAQVRQPMGEFVVTGEAELSTAVYSNKYGTVRMTGGRLMFSGAKKPFEAALRYSVLKPMEAFASQGFQITGSAPIQELTPSVTWYHRDWSKFIVEAPLMINTPVVYEKGLGQYALMEQPDQTSYIKTGSVVRKFVPELRLLYQMSF